MRRNKWIGVVKRGGCSFATKIQLATRLGAKSLIIIDNSDTSTPVMMNTIGKILIYPQTGRTGRSIQYVFIVKTYPLHFRNVYISSKHNKIKR